MAKRPRILRVIKDYNPSLDSYRRKNIIKKARRPKVKGPVGRNRFDCVRGEDNKIHENEDKVQSRQIVEKKQLAKVKSPYRKDVANGPVRIDNIVKPFLREAILQSLMGKHLIQVDDMLRQNVFSEIFKEEKGNVLNKDIYYRYKGNLEKAIDVLISRNLNPSFIKKCRKKVIKNRTKKRSDAELELIKQINAKIKHSYFNTVSSFMNKIVKNGEGTELRANCTISRSGMLKIKSGKKWHGVQFSLSDFNKIARVFTKSFCVKKKSSSPGFIVPHGIRY